MNDTDPVEVFKNSLRYYTFKKQKPWIDLFNILFLLLKL
jgi:hypothetical protein